MNEKIPKSLLAKMQEKKEGYFEFDTSAPGPFRLPILDEMVSVDIENSDLLVLVFRDKNEKKRFDIPLSSEAFSDLVLDLLTIQKNRDKFGKPERGQSDKK